MSILLAHIAIQPNWHLHWKKKLACFRPHGGMLQIKLSLAGNLIIPRQGEFGTWHPGCGKLPNLFYSVRTRIFPFFRAAHSLSYVSYVCVQYFCRLQYKIYKYTKFRKFENASYALERPSFEFLKIYFHVYVSVYYLFVNRYGLLELYYMHAI